MSGKLERLNITGQTREYRAIAVVFAYVAA